MRRATILLTASLLVTACDGQVLSGGGSRPGEVGNPTTPGGNGEQFSVTAETWPAHLLTSGEYNATAQDLLGITSRPADFFPATSATEFDANVGVLSDLSQVQGEAVFNAAKALVDEVMANQTLRARVITCTPATSTDEACPRTLISELGRRTFRRSLDTEEVDAYLALYRQARTTLELDHPAATGHVLRAMLSSPSFFLRLERLPNSGVLEPAALASRLSYLVWGSMPDETLLAAAESGALADPDTMRTQADRLLDDAKGQRFVTRFMGQWLGTVRLSSHTIDTTLHPAWTDAVETAVDTQANQFLTEFVTGTRQWKDVFSAPHPSAPAAAPLFAKDPPNLRKGFLTLPSYLTYTSHTDRTSPTARAKVIVTSLFCTEMTPPPGVTTELEPTPGGETPKTTRARLEAHRKNPACATCHDVLDPIGLSLENFDEVGSYRTMEGAQPIDASGVYMGTPIANAGELFPVLEQDARLTTCAPRKLLGYALRRSLKPGADDARVQTVAKAWQGNTIRALVHDVVSTGAFLGLDEELSR